MKRKDLINEEREHVEKKCNNYFDQYHEKQMSLGDSTERTTDRILNYIIYYKTLNCYILNRKTFFLKGLEKSRNIAEALVPIFVANYCVYYRKRKKTRFLLICSTNEQ